MYYIETWNQLLFDISHINMANVLIHSDWIQLHISNILEIHWDVYPSIVYCTGMPVPPEFISKQIPIPMAMGTGFATYNSKSKLNLTFLTLTTLVLPQL